MSKFKKKKLSRALKNHSFRTRQLSGTKQRISFTWGFTVKTSLSDAMRTILYARVICFPIHFGLCDAK